MQQKLLTKILPQKVDECSDANICESKISIHQPFLFCVAVLELRYELFIDFLAFEKILFVSNSKLQTRIVGLLAQQSVTTAGAVSFSNHVTLLCCYRFLLSPSL
jgi:hypothetical protein